MKPREVIQQQPQSSVASVEELQREAFPLRALGHRILVKPDDVEDRQGELWIPQSAVASARMAQVFGVVVSIGPNAFKAYDDGHAWCKVGERVMFAKYGGFNVENPRTKEHYRILNDEDLVLAVDPWQ